MIQSDHTSSEHATRHSRPSGGSVLSYAAAICGVASFAVGIVQVRIGLAFAIAAIIAGVVALRRDAAHAVLAKIGIALGALAVLILIGVIVVFIYKFSQLGLM